MRKNLVLLKIMSTSKIESTPMSESFLLRHLIVEDKILLMVVALQKAIDQSEVANMQSYLKALQLNIGLIVNFGKSEVHISGVRAA